MRGFIAGRFLFDCAPPFFSNKKMQTYLFFKRAEDILLSLFFLIALSPLFLATALALRFSGISPVIFKQVRAGKDGKPFVIYKFISMTNERDADGELLPDNERLTRIGRFIRKTSIDELPQFVNVLKGDMSIVGPRPLLMEYNGLYSPKHAVRLTVTPGITGLAAVSGRSFLTFGQRLDLDAEYVKKRSFWFDQKMILLTALNVVMSKDSPSEVPDNEDIDDVGITRGLKNGKTRKHNKADTGQ